MCVRFANRSEDLNVATILSNPCARNRRTELVMRVVLSLSDGPTNPGQSVILAGYTQSYFVQYRIARSLRNHPWRSGPRSPTDKESSKS